MANHVRASAGVALSELVACDQARFYKHFAPTEFVHAINAIYKHFVPTELVHVIRRCTKHFVPTELVHVIRRSTKHFVPTEFVHAINAIYKHSAPMDQEPRSGVCGGHQKDFEPMSKSF
jgi:hypothetical protein